MATIRSKGGVLIVGEEETTWAATSASTPEPLSVDDLYRAMEEIKASQPPDPFAQHRQQIPMMPLPMEPMAFSMTMQASYLRPPMWARAARGRDWQRPRIRPGVSLAQEAFTLTYSRLRHQGVEDTLGEAVRRTRRALGEE